MGLEVVLPGYTSLKHAKKFSHFLDFPARGHDKVKKFEKKRFIAR